MQSWRHRKIVLKPDTDAPGYPDIVFTAAGEGELSVIAELVSLLG